MNSFSYRFAENRLVYDGPPPRRREADAAERSPRREEDLVPGVIDKPGVGVHALKIRDAFSQEVDISSETPADLPSFDLFMARLDMKDKSREEFSQWAASQADPELLRRGNIDALTNVKDVLAKHVRLSSEYLQKMPNENGHFVFSVDFKGNEVAEWKIGAGHLLPPVVKAIKVYDGATVVCENAVRGLKDGRVGYFDVSGGYVPIHSGYKIEVLEIQEPTHQEAVSRTKEENNLFEIDAKKVAIKSGIENFFSVNGLKLPIKVDDGYFVGKLGTVLSKFDAADPNWWTKYLEGKFGDAEMAPVLKEMFPDSDIKFMQNLCRLRELRGIQQIDKTFERVQVDVTMSDLDRLKTNPKFAEFGNKVFTDEELYDFVKNGNDDQESYDDISVDSKEVGANESFVSGTDDFGNVFYLRGSAMTAFKRAMQLAAANQPPFKLKINSSHRGIAKQEGIFKEACKKYGSPSAARKWAALPGSSPHHTGGAIDVAAIVDGKGGVKHANQKYLKMILPRAGFVNYSPEPWHWEIYTKRWKKLTGAPGPVYTSRLEAIDKTKVVSYDRWRETAAA